MLDIRVFYVNRFIWVFSVGKVVIDLIVIFQLFEGDFPCKFEMDRPVRKENVVFYVFDSREIES